MKKMFYFLLLVLISACNNKLPNEVKISREIRNQVDFENCVNDFNDAVSKLLKVSFPSKVTKVDANFSVVNPGLPLNFFHLNVSLFASIERTDSIDADYYFDSEGIFLTGESEVDAISAVKQDKQFIKKVVKMINKFDLVYHNHDIPRDFIIEKTNQGVDLDGVKKWWCLTHFFCTASKTESSDKIFTYIDNLDEELFKEAILSKDTIKVPQSLNSARVKAR